MAGLTIRMTAEKQHSLQEIHQKIHLIVGAEQVAKLEYRIGEGSAWLLVYEKYFFRVGGYASLTVLLAEKEETQTADLVSSGGGEGIMNHSMGANSRFAGECVRVLEELGFAIEEKASDPLPKGLLEFFQK